MDFTIYAQLHHALYKFAPFLCPYPFDVKKSRSKQSGIFLFMYRFYFLRTTSPPRPVCAVMYSRPILAYSYGLALAGSCSASTMIQPV